MYSVLEKGELALPWKYANKRGDRLMFPLKTQDRKGQNRYVNNMNVNTMQCADISKHPLFCQSRVEMMYLLTLATRMKHCSCTFSLRCLYADPQRPLAALSCEYIE
jgi:hypothetical protein